MTREEALMWLRDITYSAFDRTTAKERQAVQMAIEALQDQCTNNAQCDKDAISRQGLLESWNELSPRGRLEFDQVIMTIPALPSYPSAEQVTSKLKNPCNSLLTEDSEDSKEQKSKLDLISRESAIEVVKGCRILCDYTDTVIKALKELPSVSAERSGEWIRRDNYKVMGEGYLWHCSLCDQSVYQDSSRDYPSENYCPNCGARMKGGAE